MTAPTMKLLDGRITKTRQAVELTYLEQFGDLKLKVYIKSDHYDENCRASISVWSVASLSWNVVASIPYSDMETSAGLVYQQNWNDERHFNDDFDRLVELAKKVLA